MHTAYCLNKIYNTEYYRIPGMYFAQEETMMSTGLELTITATKVYFVFPRNRPLEMGSSNK